MPDDFTFEQQIAVSRALPRIAKLIDREMRKAGAPGMPWSLYSWGGQRCQYISNTAREESRIAMQECLDRWAEAQDPPPHKGFS